MNKMRVYEIDKFFNGFYKRNLVNVLPMLSLITLSISSLLIYNQPEYFLFSIISSLIISVGFTYSLIKYKIQYHQIKFLNKLKQHTFEFQDYKYINYLLLSPHFHDVDNSFKEVFKETPLNLQQINNNSKEYIKRIL